MILSAQKKPSAEELVVALVVGGHTDVIADWAPRLLKMGIQLKYHHVYRSESGKTKSIPEDVGLVLIVTPLIQTNHADAVDIEASKRKITCVRVKRQWGPVAHRLEELGFREKKLEDHKVVEIGFRKRTKFLVPNPPADPDVPFEAVAVPLDEEDGVNPETLAAEIADAIRRVPSSVGQCPHNRPIESCGSCKPVKGTPEEVEAQERAESKLLTEREEELFDRLLEEEEAEKLRLHNELLRRAETEHLPVDDGPYRSFADMVLDVIVLGQATIQELISAIDPTKEGAIRGAVKRLVDEGLIVRTERGVYRAAEAARPAETPLITENQMPPTPGPTPPRQQAQQQQTYEQPHLSVRDAVKLLGRAMRQEGMSEIRIAILPSGKVAIVDEIDIDE